MKEYTLHTGDSIEVLKTMEENSIDSVVTDPPYELGFMGKDWDKSGIANSVELWKEVYRVLKPGGHLLSFGGSRTYHRMACAIEDAGFEIRDQIQWIYGSGFPKNLDVSKAFDKKANLLKNQGTGFSHVGDDGRKAELKQTLDYRSDYGYIYEPVSDSAKKWSGWGTAIKPAHEPLVLARKPFKGTVIENIEKYGVGAVNINESRIGADTVGWGGARGGSEDPTQSKERNYRLNEGEPRPVQGRWPANVILDEEAAAQLDLQSGVSKSNPRTPSKQHHTGSVTSFERGSETSLHSDSGGASRFFYTAKTSPTEREAGLKHMELRVGGGMKGTEDGSLLTGSGNERNPMRANHHPTVKPITLMRYLVRLITPPDGLVLDPFCGSGSTGCAAVMEGFNFTGIDLDPEYIEISQARIEHWKNTFDKA